MVNKNLDLFLDNPYTNPSEANYPTAFAAIDLFKSTAKDEYDHERIFHVGNSELVIKGPELTLTDEEVLIAIIQLCNKFQGKTDSKVKELVQKHNVNSFRQLLSHNPEENDDSFNDVVAGEFFEITLKGSMTNYIIAKYLDYTWGTKTKERIDNSISRLTNTVISCNKLSEEVLNKVLIEGEREYMLKFRKMHNEKNGHSHYVFSIPATLVNLLTSYVKIDLTIRQKLNPSCKILHRYLIAVGFPHINKPFEILYSQLKSDSGLNTSWRRFKTFIADDSENFQVLKSAGILSSIEIKGTGYKGNPIRLIFHP